MGSVKDKNVSALRTICEVHRDIHDILMDESISPELANKLIDLLEEAYHMGKKMDSKLRQYKNNYDDGWWKLERDKILREKLRRRGAKKQTVKGIKAKVKKGNYAQEPD